MTRKTNPTSCVVSISYNTDDMQSEEDLQLQAELEMLFERLKVSSVVKCEPRGEFG